MEGLGERGFRMMEIVHPKAEMRPGYRELVALGPAAYVEYPEFLCPEDAEYYDLNRIVDRVLGRAMPRCCAAGLPVHIEVDITLPALPILVQPIEAALDELIELCLEVRQSDRDAGYLYVGTNATESRAQVAIEYRDGSNAIDIPAWLDVRSTGRVPLIVGEGVLRSLGGRMRLLRSPELVQGRFELPLRTSRHREGCICQPGRGRRVRASMVPVPAVKAS